MDAVLQGTTAPVLDSNSAVGTADLSLNAAQQQYVISNTAFTTATATVGNGISFSGWFYPSGTQTVNSTIFDISGSGCAVSLYYGTSNQLYGYFNGAVVQSTVTVVPGSWHFFCYTIYCTSITTALQSLYIDASLNSNGAYAATNTTGSYVSFTGGTAGTGSYIGYGRGAGPVYTYFNGKIDDFRFYNRVLSLPEINVLYSFNYKSGTTPAIVSQMYYDISYVNAVQIDVSGTFSGLYVTRTAQVGAVTNTTTSTVSCANLVFVNATTWAYVDTTVAADTSYSYTVQPYVMNTSGSVVNFGSVTTTPLFNGFFNQGSSLPIAGSAAAVTTANLPGWATSGSTLFLCNGSVTGVYTGALPSTVTYYIDISQNAGTTARLSQYVGIYQGTSGMVSFFVWPRDIGTGGYYTQQTITVTLGGVTLLNNYSLTNALIPAYTITNPMFSSPAAATNGLSVSAPYNTVQTIPGWTVSGATNFLCTAAGTGQPFVFNTYGSYVLCQNPGSGSGTSFTQSVTLTPNTYTLSITAAVRAGTLNNANITLTATIAGSTPITQTFTASAMTWTAYSGTFVVTTLGVYTLTITLTQASANGDSMGFTNVTISPTPNLTNLPTPNASPYTSLNLPFTMSRAGTYLLNITTNAGTVASGMCVGGLQIRSATTTGVGYRMVDASGLALYYPFDLGSVSGTVVYDCSAGFTGLAGSADASLCGGAVLDTTQAIMGGADLSLNGSTCYVQMGSWSMPAAVTGNGFSITGWFQPSVAVEPSNATLCFFSSTACNLMVYLNQQNNWLDFSYNVAGGSEYVSNTYTIQPNRWNFFAMTAYYNGTTGVYTYYLNDVSMATQTGAWPQTSATFTNNYLGGVPVNSPTPNSFGPLGYFAGYMDDFRVYNRALSTPDILSLWSYGFASNQYANVIDMSGLGVYYPFDEGSIVLRSPPTPITIGAVTAVTSTGFTLAWSGGTGLGVTTSATVYNGSGTQTFPGISTSYSFATLAAPTAGNGYAWTVTLTAVNLVGSVSAVATVYAPPTTLVLTSSYSSPNVTLNWTGGVGTGVTLTWTLTAGTASTTAGNLTYNVAGGSQVIPVTGSGPWTFDVSAINVSGTIDALTTASPSQVTVNYVQYNSSTVTPTGSLSSGNGIVTGTSIGTDGYNYQVYSFGLTTYSYSINYTVSTATTVYVLAIGGGGGGASGGGGGAGGLYMLGTSVAAGTGTISISLGNGGSGGTSTPTNGSNTTVTFTGTPRATTITAYGGGYGATTGRAPNTGGSGGGGGYNYGPAAGNTAGNNYANAGGAQTTGSDYAGNAGGGAGNYGGTCVTANAKSIGGRGGCGLQCILPGISTFTPSGYSTFGRYYWGGGGGGSGANGAAGGPGGMGGGGGGGMSGTNNGTLPVGAGGTGINNGGNGSTASGGIGGEYGGNGGANTGGGGGGTRTGSSGTPGNGGSGFAIVAFPTIAVTPGISFLIVGGGGGGGAGGGGAGGVVYNPYITYASGLSFAVTVGAGGTAGTNLAYGTNGSNSQIVYNSTTYIASGGGCGGYNIGGGSTTPSGGCTGGAGYSGNPNLVGASNQASYTGCISYGNVGGDNGNNVGGSSGGGGGAGQEGGSCTSTTVPPNGGNGISNSITGTATYYAGGGGGSLGGSNTTSTGGLGGGGNGGGTAGVAGTANTGGGGGGVSMTSNYLPGGAGGSGVVILSIPTANYNSANFTGSGSKTVSTATIAGVSYTIIKFTSGSLTYTTA